MLCIGDDLLFTISPDTPDVVVGEEEENRECEPPPPPPPPCTVRLALV